MLEERRYMAGATAPRYEGFPPWELPTHAAWLALENRLHKRLATVVDLNDAIDGFAVWLSRQVPYDLVGFYEPSTGRGHFFCSSHGPAKHDAIATVKGLLQGSTEPGPVAMEGRCVVHPVRTPQSRGAVVVLRHHPPFTAREREIMERGLEILEQTLERVLYYELLYQQSREDSLTGLPNRRVFQEAVERAMADARRYQRPLSLAILDLDNFKEVNDTMGHDRGDEVLKEVASAVSSTIRATDLLARLGGDEFVLLMPNTTLAQASQLAKRIIQGVRRLNITTPTGRRLGISIGISQWDGRSSLDQWLKEADSLLYQAKNEGRNRFKS